MSEIENPFHKDIVAQAIFAWQHPSYSNVMLPGLGYRTCAEMRENLIAMKDELSDHATVLAAEREARERAERELVEAKAIIAECCNALPNGAYCSPDASLEFMAHVPDEVRLVMSAQVTRIAELERKAIMLEKSAGFACDDVARLEAKVATLEAHLAERAVPVDEAAVERAGQEIEKAHRLHGRSYREMAKAALSTLPRREGWQPIETAPRDGTPILVAENPARVRGPTCIHLVEWRSGRDGFGDEVAHWLPCDVDDQNGPYCSFSTDELTHWRYPPPSPAAPQEGE